MRAASSVAALVLAAGLATRAGAEEPLAPPAPHGAPWPAADDELPPPRPIPARQRPRWPPDLVRRTSLSVNMLGLVPGPEQGADGTWRVEGVVERAFLPRVGAAVLLSGGEVRKDGHDDATVLGVSGQYRWYLAGRFDRGVYLSGIMGFWSIDPYLAWSLGAGIGLKRTSSSGLALDLHAGLQLPVEWFRHDDGGNPPAIEDAWRAMLPGPLVSIGFAFPGTRRGPRARY